MVVPGVQTVASDVIQQIYVLVVKEEKMIIKIVAMIAHEIVKEYRKLNEEDRPDESVLSFSSAVAPAIDPPEEVPTTLPPTIIGFNNLTAPELREIRCLMRELNLR